MTEPGAPTTKPNNGLKRLVQWIPLAALLFAGVAAWAQQQEKTSAHEKRIEQNEKQVRALSTGQATIMERTRQMQEINRENRDTLKQVLRELRRSR